MLDSHFDCHNAVAAAVLQSSFCFIWDIHMDWGIFRMANLGGRFPGEVGTACCNEPGEQDLVSLIELDARGCGPRCRSLG